MTRHRFDPFAFLFGAMFLTVGLSVASGASGADVLDLFRTWPTAVIVTGFVLVAWTVARVLRPAVGDGTITDVDRPDRPETGYDEPAEVDTVTAELDDGEPSPPTS